MHKQNRWESELVLVGRVWSHSVPETADSLSESVENLRLNVRCSFKQIIDIWKMILTDRVWCGKLFFQFDCSKLSLKLLPWCEAPICQLPCGIFLQESCTMTCRLCIKTSVLQSYWYSEFVEVNVKFVHWSVVDITYTQHAWENCSCFLPYFFSGCITSHHGKRIKNNTFLPNLQLRQSNYWANNITMC